MRRTSLHLLVTALVLLFSTSPLWSQIGQTGNKGLLRTHSAQTLGRGVLGIGTAGYFSLDNDYVLKGILVEPDSGKAYYGDGIKPTYMSTYYSLCYGIFNWWDFNVTLPFYVDDNNMGEQGKDNGVGDVALSMKIQYPPYEHSHVFDMTYFGELYLPTAKKGGGLYPRQPYYTNAQNIKPGNDTRTAMRSDLDYGALSDSLLYKAVINDSTIAKEDYFYGTRNISFLMKMLWTFDASELNPDVNIKWHTNFGALFSGNQKTDNIFVLSSSLEWTPHPVLTLFTDFYGQARFSQLSSGFDLGKEPLILGSGVCVNIPGGAHLTVAFDKCFSFNDKYKTVYYNINKDQAYQTKIFPDYGISVGVSWNGSVLGSDSDKDGIPDKIDNCPDEPEDVDGFEDYDGCPDNDNDRDGILDIRDKCPNKAEDMDNFADEDGCPDNDNDKDGIADQADKCVNDAEDRDGFEDKDGCADFDNDRDGIADSLDRCIIDPEDMDGFEDKDGCVDLDNDKDAIPDVSDKCPNQPENLNNFQDMDGCPDVKVAEIQPKMTLEGVNFKTGSAELTFESGAILDQVLASVVAYPEVCLEIRGHTDNVGGRDKNVQLSSERAASVKAYMVSKGIEEKRIKAVGVGPDQPVAPNTKAEGRAKNRRIEMYRVPCN